MHNLFHMKRATLAVIGVVLTTATSLGSCGSNAPKPSPQEVVAEGFLELRGEARKVVSDSVRREKYLTATMALEASLSEFDQVASSIIHDYQTAFADYNADKAVLSALAAKYRAEQSKAIASFVEAHTSMAASVTSDEWKPLAKQEEKLMKNLTAAARRSLE